MLPWIDCNQCLDLAACLQKPITAQEAKEQRELLASYHADHTYKDETD